MAYLYGLFMWPIYMTLGRLWVDFGSTLGRLWVTLGRLWVDFWVTLGRLLGDFGSTLGRLWGDFGVTLGSLWHHFGMTFGQLPTNFRLFPKSSGTHSPTLSHQNCTISMHPYAPNSIFTKSLLNPSP